MIYTLNRLFTGAFNALFFPFAKLSPIWALTAISFLAGIVMVWIFGKVSNQAAIKTIRNKISGNLLGVRLYRHDLRVVFALQRRILRDTLIYMGHSLLPLAIMLIPMTLILIQLEARFSARPLHANERALLKVKVRDAETLREKIELQTPDGILVDSPPVRIASEREIAWRIKPTQAGCYNLTLLLGDQAITKSLCVGPRWETVSEIRTGGNVWERLLHPAEPPLDAASPIESIAIPHPPLSFRLFGWNTPWLLIFFVLSLVFGFAVKGFMGVEV